MHRTHGDRSVYLPFHIERHCFVLIARRLEWIVAGMAELADAHGLGPCALKACRFKSCSRHHRNLKDFPLFSFAIGLLPPHHEAECRKLFSYR
jgi:hypothetical protein